MDAGKETVLAAHHVSFGYPARGRLAQHPVLRGVSVDIPKGSLAGLLGPNGSGKSTFLKILSGVLSPVEGHVTLAGRPLASLSRREIARRIAVVPQETHPAFEFTVIEMVMMGRHPFLGAFQLEGPRDLRAAEDALESTGSTHLAGRAFSTLSGGEKQRVVIASALAQSMDVLLLDEPTAALDLGSQLEIAALLAGLQRTRGMTLVLATHDLNLAASLCDSVVMLHGGVVVAAGRTDDVLSEANVRALYGVDSDIRFHAAAGHLTVTPVRRAR